LTLHVEASANKIIAVMPTTVIPARIEKIVPVCQSAVSLVANMITAAGADRVITMDLHAPQIQAILIYR
jgi:ribose-phosphate pyrophosphokinase